LFLEGVAVFREGGECFWLIVGAPTDSVGVFSPSDEAAYDLGVAVTAGSGVGSGVCQDRAKEPGEQA
jgi:hypothetical protein